MFRFGDSLQTVAIGVQLTCLLFTALQLLSYTVSIYCIEFDFALKTVAHELLRAYDISYLHAVVVFCTLYEKHEYMN